MIIAVNTRLNKDTQPQGYEAFLFSMLDHLSKKFPQHQFMYIFDAPYKNIVFPKNVLPVVTGPKASSSLRLQYWFNYRLVLGFHPIPLGQGDSSRLLHRGNI